MKILNSLRLTMESIMRIIQENPPFQIPISLDKSFLLLSYCQLAVYILKDSEDRSITNPILKSIFSIVQFASLNQTLIIQSTDVLSLLILITSTLALLTFFSYAVILAIIKAQFATFYEMNKQTITAINSYMNFCFYVFIFCFHNYQIELSTSIMFCGNTSLLTTNRSYDNCNVLWWQYTIGICGLIFVGFFTLINIMFFKSVEFHQTNRLTRTMTFPYQFIIAVKCVATLVEMSNIEDSQVVKIRHTLIHVYALVNLLDGLFNHAYSNREISRFNLTISSYFYCLVAVCNLWKFTKLITEYEIFFYVLVSSILLQTVVLATQSYNYERLFEVDIFMKFRKDRQKTQPKSFPIDVYLEELVAIAEDSLTNETNKYKTFRIFTFHVQSCSIAMCPCKNGSAQNLATAKAALKAGAITQKALESPVNNNMATSVKSKKSYQNMTQIHLTQSVQTRNQILTSDGHDINLNQIYMIVDEIFRWLLEQRSIVEDSRRFESLSLKYITFMVKYQKNYVRAFYELKVLLQRRSFKGHSFSLYFDMLSKIIAEDLSVIISKINDQNLFSKRKEELTFKHITDSDQLCWEFMPRCISVLKEKQLMWTKMQKGFVSMNAFQKEVIHLSNIIETTRNEYFKSIARLQQSRDFTWCLMMKKLNMVFYLFVMNDYIRAYELEQDVLDLRKRDAFLEEDCLNNENLVKKNIVTLMLSISQSLGRIVSRKDEKTAEFFGYTKQEFQKITSINELMPQYMSMHHDTIVSAFLKRGSSRNIKSAMVSFARDSLGYVMPIQIHLDFCFENNDDFLMQGTLLKIDKAADYILFDRKARILGISKRFAEMLLVESEILEELPPQAESILRNLNAFTLLPKLIRALVGKKKEIKELQVNQDSEILISDSKGSIFFDNALLTHSKTFATFLSSSSEASNNNNINNTIAPMNSNGQSKQLFFTRQQKRFQRNISNQAMYSILDTLDVFSKEAYEKYISFKELSKVQAKITSTMKLTTTSFRVQQPFDKQESTHSNKSRKEAKNRPTNLQIKSKNQLNQTSNNSTNNLLQQTSANIIAIKDNFKISFRFTLSFHTLKVPISNRHSTNSRQANDANRDQNSNGTQNQKGDKSSEMYSKNLFFAVRMRDLKLQKAHKQESEKYEKVKLLAFRIATYLKSISSVAVISNYFNLIALNSNNNMNSKQKLPQLMEYTPIPKSFITYVNPDSKGNKNRSTFFDQQSQTSRSNGSQFQKNSPKKQKIHSAQKQPAYASANMYRDSSRSNFSASENQTDIISEWHETMQDTSSDNSQEFSRLSLDSQGNANDRNIFATPKYAQYISDQFLMLTAQPNELDDLLRSNSIQPEDLFVVDANYAAKRVISAKIKARRIVNALEIALLDVIMSGMQVNTFQIVTAAATNMNVGGSGDQRDQNVSQLLYSENLNSSRVDSIRPNGEFSQVTFRNNDESEIKGDDNAHSNRNQIITPNAITISPADSTPFTINQGNNTISYNNHLAARTRSIDYPKMTTSSTNNTLNSNIASAQNQAKPNYRNSTTKSVLFSQLSITGPANDMQPISTLHEDDYYTMHELLPTQSAVRVSIQTENNVTEENLNSINGIKASSNSLLNRRPPFMKQNSQSITNNNNYEYALTTEEPIEDGRSQQQLQTSHLNLKSIELTTGNNVEMSFSELPSHAAHQNNRSNSIHPNLTAQNSLLINSRMNFENNTNHNTAAPLMNSLFQTATLNNLNKMGTNQNLNEELINSLLSDNVDGENNGQKSQATHEVIVANILNQSGMLHGKNVDNNNVSVHSSSKSTGSNGTYFLREIIYKSKIPFSAVQFSFMMIVFSVVFISLNITNLMIIRQDMQSFTNNVAVLRLPRKLLRDYVKTTYGYYLLLQLEGGYFIDTPTNFYKSIAEEYITNSARSYNEIIESNQQTLTASMQDLQNYLNVQTETFYFSKDFKQHEQEVDIAMMFNNPINFLLGVQANMTSDVQASSFITLRSNLYTMKNYVLELADFLVDGVLTTADNLILKFTLISVAAIICLLLIPLISYSIASAINNYEEKILMMASRITLEHSEIEKFKLSVCARLLSMDTYDWLKYQYLDVISLRFNAFDIKSRTARITSFHSNNNNTNNNNNNNNLKSNLNANNTTNRKNKEDQRSGFSRKRSLRSTQLRATQLMNNAQDHGSQSINSKQSAKNNYILQSKIGSTRLSVMKRITNLILLMTVGIAYFLVIIIFLNVNRDSLKKPVSINRTANFLHANAVAFVISSELLAYDAYLSQLKWPKYSLNDLGFFYTSLKDSLKVAQEQKQTLSNDIYGDNPYPAETEKQFKDLIQGESCAYLVNYSCSAMSAPTGLSTVQTMSEGVAAIVTDYSELFNAFSNVLTPDTTVEEDLKVYLNSKERIETFVRGFQSPDEILDVLGVIANTSIGTVSLSIQDFLELYLQICGNILAVIIIAIFLVSWKNLQKTIHLMNLFLTFIPEEKLSEDVTLQMLKSIRRM